MHLNVIKYLAPVVVVGFLWLRYDYVTTENERLKSDLSEATASLEQSQAIIDRERQNAAEVALRAQKFYEENSMIRESLIAFALVSLINLAGCASSVAPAPQCPVPTPMPEELKQPMPPIEDNLSKIILVS